MGDNANVLEGGGSVSSALEQTFSLQLQALGCPGAHREHQFHPERRWRFDFAWPTYKIAVELEGGTWTGGRHVRGAGFAADCAKYNAAALLGWRVLRYTAASIDDWSAAKQVAETLRKEARGTGGTGVRGGYVEVGDDSH